VICPECGNEFKGGAYSVTGANGYYAKMRKCDNGHAFPEPKRVRKQTEADRLRAYWLEAQTEVNRLRAENAKLREYIKERGHSDPCMYNPGEPCFCGHDAALAGAAEVKHE
jgi:hypothetical protein